MKILYALIVLTLVISACSSPATQPPAPTMTPYQSCLCCTEYCKTEMDGMKINLWTHPNRSGVESKVPTDTAITVIEEMNYDGMHYYRVKSTWGNGWVSELFMEQP